MNTIHALQDSDKRAQAAATAVDGAPLGRKSEAAAAAADAEVSAAVGCWKERSRQHGCFTVLTECSNTSWSFVDADQAGAT